MSAQGRVLAGDYHRNGVAGAGFYVAVVQEDKPEAGPKVMIYFPGAMDLSLAVLDMGQLQGLNVYMHPSPGQPETGGAAFRGDRFTEWIPKIEAFVEAQREAIHADIAAKRAADVEDLLA